MNSRPQWLTIHTAEGEDIKMRLPARPSVQDVKAMLDQIGRLAEHRARQMRRTSNDFRRKPSGGWSLTQGPVMQSN